MDQKKFRKDTHPIPRLLGPAILFSSLLHPLQVAASNSPQRPSLTSPADDLTRPPRAWAVDVAANEIRSIQHENSYVRYQIHTQDQKGDRVRDTIETKDGAVARMIMRDGKPLTPEDDKLEQNRLNDILSSPSEFARHIHNDVTGKKLATDLIRLMPDAMTYTYAPGQPQIASPISPQIVLDYAPNPQWSPPSTTAEALTGLRGRMWIDPGSHQLLRMEGNIFQGVNFGWGMLAHIYPGGTLSLTQVKVAGDRWIFSSFVERIRIRALMLRSINVRTDVQASNFQVLPRPLTYIEAVRILLATPPPTH